INKKLNNIEVKNRVQVPDFEIKPDSEARLDPLLVSTSIQNTPLSENLTPIGNLISFDENILTYYPNMSNIPVVDFLIDDIPDIKAESKLKDNKSNNPESQVYHFLDLDIEYTKDIFKVDRAKYAFSTWFAEIKSKNYKARMTEERAQEILNVIENSEFLIRVKFIQNDSIYGDESQTKITFKIIDKYKSIHESKKASKKYVRDGPNVILTKKTKPEFWVEIDEKFLVREVSKQSEVERLDSNTVVYRLYRI
ncbi:28182_t:CDS:2, partial [Racocetra persica]